jgi:hypothetical protein
MKKPNPSNLYKSKNQPAREGKKWKMDSTAARSGPEAAAAELQRRCLEEKKKTTTKRKKIRRKKEEGGGMERKPSLLP